MEKGQLLRRIVAILFLLLAPLKEILAMDRAEFWEVIEVANSKLAEHPYDTEYLVEAFGSLPRAELISAYRLQDVIVAELDCNNIYALGSVLAQRKLSDDGFLYFRNWLISLGKEAVEGLIKDPVSLLEGNARVRERLLDSSSEMYQDFNYFIPDTFLKKFGVEIYDEYEVEILKSDVMVPEGSHSSVTMEEIFIKYGRLVDLLSS